MEEKKISYEEINTSEITNVQFCTWIDKGNYAPYHWHRAIEIVYVLEGELLVTAENHSKLRRKIIQSFCCREGVRLLI